MLAELFQNAPNKHKPEVSITFYKDKKITDTRKVLRVEWLTESICLIQ